MDDQSMRKKYLAFLLAGCMTAGVPSMAWAAEQTTEAAVSYTHLTLPTNSLV